MENETNNPQALLAELKEQIAEELQLTDGVDTPFVYSQLQTPASKESLITRIAGLVVTGAEETIGEAINAIEKENNPNKLD
jgi:hypothetical protein